MSPKTRGRDYHLTLREGVLFMKILHYAKNNEKITYSNKVIGMHAYLKVSTVEKVIRQLIKLGYISSSVSTIIDSGNYYRRRTIFIKWDKLEFVLSETPENEVFEDIMELVDEFSEIIIEEAVPMAENNTVTEVIPLNADNLSAVENSELNGFVLTDEKLSWMLKLLEQSEKKMSEERIKTLPTDTLTKFFYGEDGVWSITEKLQENKYLMRVEYNVGTNCKLINLNSKSDYLLINQNRFFDSMLENDVKFGDLTVEMYHILKNNEVQRLNNKTA